MSQDTGRYPASEATEFTSHGGFITPKHLPLKKLLFKVPAFLGLCKRDKKKHEH